MALFRREPSLVDQVADRRQMFAVERQARRIKELSERLEREADALLKEIERGRAAEGRQCERHRSNPAD